MSNYVDVGGQAVIEGVMMKTAHKVATAVRKEDGTIVMNVDSFNSVTNKHRFYKLPFIRGVISLFELMYLGVKTLTWSANQQGGEEEQIESWQMTLTVIVSLLLSVGIFILLPYGLSYLITPTQDWFFNTVDGVFRLLIFITYLSGIGMMRDIHRVFQYHGAEHKTVNCYEQGKELTPENVLSCSRIHPRCGTSLIVFVLGLSIVLFSLLKSEFWFVNLGWRIILIPVIAGVAFEVVKFSAKHVDNIILGAIIKPGLLTQELTTREPDAQQCEVAIKALQSAVGSE